MTQVRLLSLTLAMTLLCTGCGTTQVTSQSMAGISTGAAVGNILGSAVGGLIGDSNDGWHGAYRGSSIGSILGTMVGATVGYAITTPKREKSCPEENGIQNGLQQKPVMETVSTSPLNSLHIENVHFISENQQQIIRPEGVYKITFEILNKGTESATAIIPWVREISGKKRLHISPSLVVDRIDPHNGIRYTATVKTGRKIKTGEAVFRISIADAANQEYDWLEFAIPTEK